MFGLLRESGGVEVDGKLLGRLSGRTEEEGGAGNGLGLSVGVDKGDREALESSAEEDSGGPVERGGVTGERTIGIGVVGPHETEVSAVEGHSTDAQRIASREKFGAGAHSLTDAVEGNAVGLQRHVVSRTLAAVPQLSHGHEAMDDEGSGVGRRGRGHAHQSTGVGTQFGPHQLLVRLEATLEALNHLPQSQEEKTGTHSHTCSLLSERRRSLRGALQRT